MHDIRHAIDLAQRSPPAGYEWKDRGVAPAGYTNGMAAALAETYRMLRAGDPAVTAATQPQRNDPDHDVLKWYEERLSRTGARLDTAEERLVAVFAVLLGLGMRESSGKHCDGPDTPADRGAPGHPVATTPENAEAGLFQVSHDSIRSDPDRRRLFGAYSGRADLLDVFSDGSGCRKPRGWPAGDPGWPSDFGAGEPAAFQAQMKNCPLSAALYSAALLRENRGHWGPINHRQAEVKAEAIQLFRDIAALVDAE